MRRVLDLGCSVGVGTFALRDWLQERQPSGAALEGLDLSPEMLAVAKVREAESLQPASRQREVGPALSQRASDPAPDQLDHGEQQGLSNSSKGEPAPITWHHAAAEATGLASGAYDLITLQFVFHELPQSASHAVLREAARLLRPGEIGRAHV